MFFMTIPQVKELHGALTAIKKAVPKTYNETPVVLEVKGGHIRISALLDGGIAEYRIFCPTATFATMQITDAAGMVNGLKATLDAAKAGNGNALACEQVGEGLKLSVCGAEIILFGKFERAGGAVEGFSLDVDTQKYRLSNRCILQGDALKGVLANIIPFMGQDENMPSFKGLNIEFRQGGTVRAVATDTYRIAYQELGNAIGECKQKNALIPNKIIGLVDAFLGKDGEGAIVQVKYYTRHVEDGADKYLVSLQNGKWSIRTFLLEQPAFPKYENLDWTTPAIAHVRYTDGKALDKALMMLAKAADDKHSMSVEIGRHETIFTTNKNGAVTMTQRVPHEWLGGEGGEIREAVKLKLNAEYLRDVIAKQPCEVKYRSGRMPVIFERPGLSAMIMPIR